MNAVPLHETHEERLDRLHTFSAPPWVSAASLVPTPRDVATVRVALDRFNARHVDIIVTERARLNRTIHKALQLTREPAASPCQT